MSKLGLNRGCERAVVLALLLTAAGVGGVGGAGCNRNAANETQASAATSSSATPSPAELPAGHPKLDPQALPQGHPAVEPAGALAAAPAPTGPATAGGLTWDDAAPLVRRAPKSQMRAAEYGLADEPRAELSVFYFGPGAAGGVDANIQRWLGQFSQPDGSDTAKLAHRSELTVSGVVVNLVEATGTFAGGMGPSAGAGSDFMLLGAIANGPNGAVFFKLTGPRASLESARNGFSTLIKSLRPDTATAAPSTATH